MAWIESHQSLRNHPKTTLATKKLGIHKAQLIGHLHLLWWWCADYAPDGRLDKFTPDQIADAAEWPGNPGEFLQHMADIGFIDRDPLCVHDWQSYRLHFDDLQSRRERKLKQVRRRVDKWRKRNAVGNAPVTQKTPATYITDTTYITNKKDKEKYLDFVWLAPEEHGKLQTALGSRLPQYLQRLNGYIGQIGEKKAAAKYTSHYHTILNWHRKDAEEGKTNAPNGSASDPCDTPLARRAREVAGLRKAGMRDFGQISPGLRNMPAALQGPEQPDGKRDEQNGADVDGVLPEGTALGRGI